MLLHRTRPLLQRPIFGKLERKPHGSMPGKLGPLATAAGAAGALAVGALAIGAIAMGALAIGRLAIGRARIRRLEIDELVVRKLRVTDKLETPGTPWKGRDKTV